MSPDQPTFLNHQIPLQYLTNLFVPYGNLKGNVLPLTPSSFIATFISLPVRICLVSQSTSPLDSSIKIFHFNRLMNPLLEVLVSKQLYLHR